MWDRDEERVERPDLTTDWTRQYEESLRREDLLNREAEQQAARERARLPPVRVRRRRRAFAVVCGAIYALSMLSVVLPGGPSREVAHGGGLPGTVVLSQQVVRNYGRPPGSRTWEGRFLSDDGSQDRIVTFAEPIPEAKRRVGEVVEAVWVSSAPDSVYLRGSQAAYKRWVTAMIFLTAFNAVFISILVVVWRRRVRLRRTISP